jgi:trk system potassium uptake protein TrkA
MHFIIVGCGRVGVSLAMMLQEMQHDISIIDNNEDSFRLLPDDYKGKKVHGFGFDKNTLLKAGIQNAFALAAVTDNDNTNILTVRLAKEEFSIPKVVARVYNSSRAEFFERFGIPTVATIRWTTNQVLRHMIPLGATDVYRDSTGEVSLVQIDFDESWITHSIGEIERTTKGKVAFINRNNKSFLPKPSSILQLGDQLFMLFEKNNIDKASHILSKRFELTVGKDL